VDAKTAKRIDSLYRNLKSFPLLVVLAFFVPLLQICVLPLSLGYLYLRRKLLKDVDAGKITFNRATDDQLIRPDPMTLEEKATFIRRHSTRLWLPMIIVVAVILLLIVLLSTMDPTARSRRTSSVDPVLQDVVGDGRRNEAVQRFSDGDTATDFTAANINRRHLDKHGFSFSRA
jgi:hypothetical protein